MQQFFRNTKLYQLIRQASAEMRSLRIAEHRASLKLKRAAVRMRVIYQIQQSQLEQNALRIEAARMASRLQQARRVISAHEAVRKQMDQAAQAAGVQLPSPTNAAQARRAQADEFKSKTIQNVQRLIPTTGVAASKMASQLLRDSVKDVKIGNDDPTQMSVQMIVGLAKQVGASKEEMEQILQQAAPDGQIIPELRDGVMKAMDDVNSSKQRTSAEQV